MKKRIGMVLGCVLLFAAQAVFAQKSEVQTSGILYGQNWACMVTAPKGWLMDQQRLAQYGIYALFYEQGKTFGGDTPIIYINTQKLSADTDEALQAFVQADIANYQKRQATISEVTLPDVTEKTLVCYRLEMGNNLEVVAYTRYKDCGFLAVLTAHDEKTLAANTEKLAEVINAMTYMDISLQ